MLAILIFAALLISNVHCACECYVSKNTTGNSVQIANAYDSDTFEPCLPTVDCSFYAYSGSDAIAWQNISVSFGTGADDSSKILIYDGSATSPKFIITPKSPSLTLIPTQNPFIRVQYNQPSGSPSTYFGAIKAGGPLATTTLPQSTTVVPTTQPFNSTIFTKNPLLISHDLFIVVNSKSSQGKTGLTAINSLASSLVASLNIVNSSSAASGTRLTLGVFSYGDIVAPQGNVWAFDPAHFNESLPIAPINGINIPVALQKLPSTYFKINGSIPTRARAQRTVLLFTSDADSYTFDDDFKNEYLNYGVNLAIVGYNLPANLSSPSATRFYNFKNVADTSITSVSSFVNDFFFSGNPAKNNWIDNPSPFSGGNQTFQLPAVTYQGPRDGLTDGQKGNYLNYQDSTYQYTNANKRSLTVSVNYELEVEQDYLRFYADGQEIESFTGYDVNTAKFTVPASVQILTARFTSDNKNVYGGFDVSIVENAV